MEHALDHSSDLKSDDQLAILLGQLWAHSLVMRLVVM